MERADDRVCAGLVSNIQKYSLHDGPGIRTTVFLKGCPLNCAWCHNPENLLQKPELSVDDAKCVRCGQCIPACPRGRWDSTGSTPAFRPVPTSVPEDAANPECAACGACSEACPTGAKTIIGRWMAESDLLREILSDRIFFDDSKGGVTFSGGEPLLQHAFLSAMLKACRACEIHTAVDTCGYTSEANLRRIVPVTDLFLFDLKFVNDDKHREFTGVSNKSILHNLTMLGHIHRQIWVRIPVIPGVNDGELEAMADLIAGVKSVRQVNLLPYHQTGLHKFARTGRDYRLAGVMPPSREYMEAVREKFASLRLPIIVGG